MWLLLTNFHVCLFLESLWRLLLLPVVLLLLASLLLFDNIVALVNLFFLCSCLGSILSRGWGSILSRMFIEGSKYLWSFKSCSYISTPSTSPFIRKAVNFEKFDIMPRKRRTECTPFFAHIINLVFITYNSRCLQIIV